ncbi:MAG: hypothetical protein ACLUD1_01365 [Clostridia bacterium]
MYIVMLETRFWKRNVQEKCYQMARNYTTVRIFRKLYKKQEIEKKGDKYVSKGN